MNNLEFDKAKLQDIVEKLSKEITDLENTYKDIENKMSVLGGSNEIWKSDTQKTVYEYYQEIQKDFKTSVENLNKCKEFLIKTIENYEGSISSNEKNADDNGDSLNIN